MKYFSFIVFTRIFLTGVLLAIACMNVHWSVGIILVLVSVANELNGYSTCRLWSLLREQYQNDNP